MYKLFVLGSYEKYPIKMAFDMTNIILEMLCTVLNMYVEIVLALCTLITYEFLCMKWSLGSFF